MTAMLTIGDIRCTGHPGQFGHEPPYTPAASISIKRSRERIQQGAMEQTSSVRAAPSDRAGQRRAFPVHASYAASRGLTQDGPIPHGEWNVLR
jgi:hypothetical protein